MGLSAGGGGKCCAVCWRGLARFRCDADPSADGWRACPHRLARVGGAVSFPRDDSSPGELRQSSSGFLLVAPFPGSGGGGEKKKIFFFFFFFPKKVGGLRPIMVQGGCGPAGGKKAWSGKRPPILWPCWRALGPAGGIQNPAATAGHSQRRPLPTAVRRSAGVPDHVCLFATVAKHSCSDSWRRRPESKRCNEWHCLQADHPRLDSFDSGDVLMLEYSFSNTASERCLAF